MKKISATSTDRAAVYRQAARYIEERDEPLPLAVKRITGTALMRDDPAIDAIKEFFYDKRWLWADEGRERQGIRILALCFMAAMVEAGDA